MKNILIDLFGLLIIILMLTILSSCAINIYEGGSHYHVNPGAYNKEINDDFNSQLLFPNITPGFYRPIYITDTTSEIIIEEGIFTGKIDTLN